MLLALLLISGPGRPVRVTADAVITVTTTAQRIDPADGFCSLQEAIHSANFDDNIVPSSWSPFASVDSECAAGSGDDTIVLQAGATYTMTGIQDDAYNPTGPTATPIVLSNITIEGHGARLVRNNPNLDFASPNFRAFAVANQFFVDPSDDLPIAGDGFGKLTIRNLEIIGFTAKGGNGIDGSGGGLGAGGAIYTAGAELTIESSTFVNNGAGGGNGSAANDQGPAGGGGGLGGHGGKGDPDAASSVVGGPGPGGGGGGARGTGGANGFFAEFNGSKQWLVSFDGGGGGGGTLRDGETNRVRGFRCGGKGAEFGDHGESGTCPGGGGGGGYADAVLGLGGDGGGGAYGGGGGGGSLDTSAFNDTEGDGGNGGFGGGGGGAARDEDADDGGHGGDGGFGAGGGSGISSTGDAGPFAGNGNRNTGGAGAGLGGAIFSHLGNVTIRNSTFTRNYAVRGEAASGGNSADDAGGAVFAVDGTLTILNSTFSANENTGDHSAVMMYRYQSTATFSLRNTIIVDSLPAPAVEECGFAGGVSYEGSGNLIGNSTRCTGSVSGDAKLAALALNLPGLTRTMAIGADSDAWDTGDDDVCEPVDQRGVTRPQSFGCDIGAYEFIRPSANLTIAKRALDPAIAGRDLAYAIDVLNLGPTAAENVSWTDTLPAGVSFVSIVAPGFSCSGTTTVTCTKASMSAGEFAAPTLTVRIPANLAHGTSLTNTATVSSSTEDPVPANNSTTVTNTVVANADLSISKSPSSALIAGADVTYAIAVANNGPSDAQTVEVSDTIAVNTTFRGLTKPAGWSCIEPLVGASGPALVKCTRSTLAAAGTAAFSLVVRPLASIADGTQLCNSAGVSTTTVDPLLGNNTAQTCGSVLTRADLSLTQSVATQGKPGRGTATFTMTVRNNGPSDAQNISMVASSSLFTGPSAATVTTTPAGVCTVAGGTVTCSWTSLALGATSTATITVPWRSSVGQVCNNAAVSAGTVDPNAINNSAGACIGKK